MAIGTQVIVTLISVYGVLMTQLGRTWTAVVRGIAFAKFRSGRQPLTV